MTSILTTIAWTILGLGLFAIAGAVGGYAGVGWVWLERQPWAGRLWTAAQFAVFGVMAGGTIEIVARVWPR